MPELRFEGEVYQVDDFDTVLNTLLKHGHAIPNFCRSGICHSCMMKAEEGTPLPFTQIGLSDDLVAENYFLTCQCAVYAPLAIRRPDKDKRTRFVAMVRGKQALAGGVVRLVLRPEHEFVYQAGQYTTLTSVEGQSGDFPIASVYSPEQGLMVFHVADDPDRDINRYICSELEEGDALEVQTALGDCYYDDTFRDRDLLLVGVDTDIAGAMGLAAAARRQSHLGTIRLLAVPQSVGRDYFQAACESELAGLDHVSLQIVSQDELLRDGLDASPSAVVLVAAMQGELGPRIAARAGDLDCRRLYRGAGEGCVPGREV